MQPGEKKGCPFVSVEKFISVLFFSFSHQLACRFFQGRFKNYGAR